MSGRLSNCRGVILAGGNGTRLGMLTKATNKHLLPIYDVPMIFHSIFKLVGASIKDILIVSGGEHLGSIASVVGSGKDLDCNISYKVQPEAGGIAQALSLAEDFVKDFPFVVLLGDNIFEDRLFPLIRPYEGSSQVVLCEVDTPERFGVVKFHKAPEGSPETIIYDKYKQIERIVEKPKIEELPSKIAVTGIYLYDKKVFPIIRGLSPSARGELEITDVNNRLIECKQMTYSAMTGWWTDAGTPESLWKANMLVHERPPKY